MSTMILNYSLYLNLGSNSISTFVSSLTFYSFPIIFPISGILPLFSKPNPANPSPVKFPDPAPTICIAYWITAGFFNISRVYGSFIIDYSYGLSFTRFYNIGLDYIICPIIDGSDIKD